MSLNPNQVQNPNQVNQYEGYTPPQVNNPYGAQQGGYQQSGNQYTSYQQPPSYGQQHYGASAGLLGPTSMGMQANVAAGLSYLFGWIGGLIFFLGEKQNRFVRFHAMQSLLLSGSLTLLYIVLWVVDIVSLAAYASFLPLLFSGLFWLAGLAGFVLWIVLLINAFQGRSFKLPVIGDYAEKFANPVK